MTDVQVNRHFLDFGETLNWEATDGVAEFFVWAKRSADGAAMRWKRVAGWDVANDQTIAVPEASGNINLTGPELVAEWDGLLIMFDGFDPEILQVTSHGPSLSGRALICRDLYTLPAPTSVNAQSIAAQERKYLQTLVGIITDKGNVNSMIQFKVATPDGTSVERMQLAALERRIAETRARIAWFEAAAEGDPLPRMEMR